MVEQIKKQPEVCIIVVNWDGQADTIECLQSLKKINYVNYRVVVVDNNSSGNDVEVLKDRFGDYIHVIQNNKNFGFAGGNNIGISHALTNDCPDYFVILNNDTIIDPAFINEMVGVAETSENIGIVGPKTYFYSEPNRLQAVWGTLNFTRAEPSQHPPILAGKWRRREMDVGQYDEIRSVDYVGGSCFMIKNNVVARIGMLDESFSSYWEETDYFYRAKKAGFQIIYVPSARVWHKGGRSAGKVPGKVRYYMTRNRFWFMKKHATRRQYACFLIYFFGCYFWIASGYYLLLHGSPAMLANFFRGIRDGLLNNPGNPEQE